jgi:hypothetical protein
MRRRPSEIFFLHLYAQLRLLVYDLSPAKSAD